MIYLIIGFALLLIIAPIFAILPSARQKEQMNMRRKAMAEGVSVELTSIQDPVPNQDKYISNTGKPLEPVLGVVAYRVSRKKPRQWRLAPQIDWVLERGDQHSPDLPGTWCWVQSKPDALPAEMEKFLIRELACIPGDVVRIDEKNYVLSIYWHESSGEEGLASVCRFLSGCIEIPLHYLKDDLDPDKHRSSNPT
ncbi:MAG: hypothetical protein CMQ20_01360 [Gammaproteobacteria bacterium]|jgi:hypothetical protein|nr:hypothetical protein [Gammaproteobacteria bacterium]|tara:strand:+ start:1195 stop:1779 length:585 start_codon:yes stop_codon:yes gene_type:complete